MYFGHNAPWAPSRVDMCALQIFIIIIITFHFPVFYQAYTKGLKSGKIAEKYLNIAEGVVVTQGRVPRVEYPG